MPNRGFTLIELAIVIVIAGVLAAIAVPIYQALVEDSKWSEAESAVGVVARAVGIYRTRESGYSALPTAEETAAATGTWFQTLELDLNEFQTLKYFELSEFTLRVPAVSTDNSFIIRVVQPGSGSGKPGRPEGTLEYNGNTKLFTKS